jgi:hypothetical protein
MSSHIIISSLEQENTHLASSLAKLQKKNEIMRLALLRVMNVACSLSEANFIAREAFDAILKAGEK